MPDSENVNDTELSRTKVIYVVNHAIAPYFKIILIDFVKNAGHFAIVHDESLNDTHIISDGFSYKVLV